MIIMIRSRYSSRVSQINSAVEGTGIVNLMGNKGGVGVSFNVGPLSFCFVDVHLAAHKHNLDARNTDLIQVVGRLKLGKIQTDLASQFHALFLFGDANYRLNMDTQEVYGHIVDNELDPLLEADELINLQKMNELFYGFNEGKITFRPTYKFERGSPASYDLTRTPAWCDRILWKHRQGVYLEQQRYEPVFTIRTSDHKAVRGEFVVGLQTPQKAGDEKEEDKGDKEGKEAKEAKSPKDAKIPNSSNVVSQQNVHLSSIDLSHQSDQEMRTVRHPFYARQHFEMVFASISIHDIRGRYSVALSQPFISFRSEFWPDNLDTDVIMSPATHHSEIQEKFEWNTSMMPELKTLMSWDELAHKCIILVVRDRSLLGDVDIVGQACLDLRYSYSSQPVKFHCPVIQDTRYNGYLLGNMHIRAAEQ